MSKKQLALIDFGAGNLHSVYKAFKFIGANVEITRDIYFIEKADGVIFPGVGAFGAVMKDVRKAGLEDCIKKAALSGKPFFGICVGMQVLFETGEENPEEKGLSIFKGNVIKFKKAKRIPHIGWNVVEPCNGSSIPLQKDKFYFVHSYYVDPQDKSIISTKSEYEGEEFLLIYKKDNLLAVQFHPEKSGEVGLGLLEKFRKIGKLDL